MSENTIQALLDDVMLFHEQEVQRLNEQREQEVQRLNGFYQQQQQQLHMQMSQHMQAQVQQAVQATQQHFMAEIEALRARVEELQKRLQERGDSGAPPAPDQEHGSSTSAQKPKRIEVEIEVDDVVYTAELDVITVSNVRIFEVMPGAVVPVDECKWANGRLVHSAGLDAQVYVLLENAINEDYRRLAARG
jgi:septum formation inhibitor MinC